MLEGRPNSPNLGVENASPFEKRKEELGWEHVEYRMRGKMRRAALLVVGVSAAALTHGNTHGPFDP